MPWALCGARRVLLGRWYGTTEDIPHGLRFPRPAAGGLDAPGIQRLGDATQRRHPRVPDALDDGEDVPGKAVRLALQAGDSQGGPFGRAGAAECEASGLLGRQGGPRALGDHLTFML